MGKKVPIDVPLTVREIAQMCDPPMKTRGMRRRLLRWHRERDETLLVKIEGLWHCTLANLRTVWPSFGKKFAEQEDIDDLSAKCDKTDATMKSCLIGLRNLRSQVNSQAREIQNLKNILVTAGLMRP